MAIIMSVAPNEVKPLLFTAEPYRDESFLGYLLRLTDLNEYETPSWLLSLADIKKGGKNRLSSYYLNSHLSLEGLAALSGIGEERLRALQYRPTGTVKSRMMGDYDVLGNSLPLYLIRLHHPKFCPPCLRDQPYARKLWELSVVTTCPLHNCLLIEKCPSCGKPPSYMRRRVWECKCGADWRKIEPVLLPSGELVITRNVYRLCGLPCGTEPAFFDEISNRLLELDLRSFVRALVFIASQYDNKVDTLGKCFEKLDNAHQHKQLIRAFHVCDDFPHNFYAFLDWRRHNPSRRHDLNRKKEVNRYGYFDGYKSALNKQLVDPQFDFLRQAFNEYVRQFKYEVSLSLAAEAHPPDPSIEVKSLRARIGKTPEDVMTATQASKKLGITVETVQKLMTSGVIDGALAASDQSKRRLFLISRASVEKLKPRLDSKLSQSYVAATLGLLKRHVNELIAGGLLEPIVGQPLGRNHKWHVTTHALRRFIDEVVSHTTLKATVKSGTLGEKEKAPVGFRYTITLLKKAGFGMCDLLNLITTGRLRVYLPKGQFSFGKLEFDTTDVLDYLAPGYRETCSVWRASKLLNVPRMKVRAFIKAGVLKAKPFPNLKEAGLRIHKDDVQAFQETYVTSDELVRRAKRKLDKIIGFIETNGIKPIWMGQCPEPVFVLHRSQVDWESLHQYMHQKSMDRIYGILRPEEAARVIGVDVGKLKDLIADGLLKPYTFRGNSRADVSKNQLLFSKHSVEKFLSRRDDVQGLISTKVAARLLGYRHPCNFMLNEVKRGFVKPIKKMDGKQYAFFFDRAAVEALAIERTRRRAICEDPAYVDTKGAAGILGVNVSAVHKMITGGIIQPEKGWRHDGLIVNMYHRSDVERLKLERDAYKARCARRGKSTRFGRPLRAA
jgi:hypothetical protein